MSTEGVLAQSTQHSVLNEPVVASSRWVRHRSTTPVLVLGHARSGTSVFSAMLRKHLRIAFGTESQFIVRFHGRLADYGDLRDADARRRLVRDLCRERWFKRCSKFGFATTPEAILADVRESSYAGILDATFRQLAKHFQTERWGDKTPEYIHHLSVIYELFPDAKYIHVVRDGRDVAISGFSTPFGAKNIYCASVDWANGLQCVRDFADCLPKNQLIEIRYEDLLNSPVDTFARLIEFLDIEAEPDWLHGHLRQAMKGDLVQGNSQKWKGILTPRQLRRFDSVSHAYLVKYGYESSVLDDRPMGRLGQAYWRLDNQIRKFGSWNYWRDNAYKLGIRLRSAS